MNVGWPPGIMMVAPGVRARLDRRETILAVTVGEYAACSRKIRVKWRRVLIVLLNVAATGVGLPYLDQGIRHGPVVFVKNAPGYDDAFAKRLAVFDRVARQVVIKRVDVVCAVNWPG